MAEPIAEMPPHRDRLLSDRYDFYRSPGIARPDPVDRKFDCSYVGPRHLQELAEPLGRPPKRSWDAEGNSVKSQHWPSLEGSEYQLTPSTATITCHHVIDPRYHHQNSNFQRLFNEVRFRNEIYRSHDRAPFFYLTGLILVPFSGGR